MARRTGQHPLTPRRGGATSRHEQACPDFVDGPAHRCTGWCPAGEKSSSWRPTRQGPQRLATTRIQSARGAPAAAGQSGVRHTARAAVPALVPVRLQATAFASRLTTPGGQLPPRAVNESIGWRRSSISAAVRRAGLDRAPHGLPPATEVRCRYLAEWGTQSSARRQQPTKSKWPLWSRRLRATRTRQ